MFQQFNPISQMQIKREPKINSWGSYTATGTEITEKEKTSL